MTGDELRRRREALGMTQLALARHLGLHHNLLWRWERDGVPAGRTQLVGIALDALEQHAQEATNG